METRGRISIGLLLLAAGVNGCGIITANNKELLAARQGLSQGNPSVALSAVAPSQRDDLPAILDRAVIYQVQGQAAESNAQFDRAIQQVRDYENRATISATEVGTGAGSLLVNDKTLEYQGEGYEKVLMHTLKARNYLMLGDEEAARVEIRNANMRQDEERKKHEDEIAEAKKKAEKQGNLGTMSQEIDKQFASSSAVLGRLDNVYQNPFATYVSGVVYELNGEPGDAFIDFKQAYRMTPNPLVASELARLATALHRQDEVAGLGLPAVSDPKAKGGNTLVFVDNGFAPERVELKFPIPEPDTVLFAAVPLTKTIPTNLSEVEVVGADGTVVGQTQMMVDIEAMSVRNLRDRYPAILIRQAIRLGAKAAAGHVAKQELGVGGMVLTSVFNAVTEQADLRAWYALPRSIHVARVNLPEGQREVTLRLVDLSGQPLREVSAPVIDMPSSKLNVVALRYVDGQVITASPPGVAVGRAE